MTVNISNEEIKYNPRDGLYKPRILRTQSEILTEIDARHDKAQARYLNKKEGVSKDIALGQIMALDELRRWIQS